MPTASQGPVFTVWGCAVEMHVYVSDIVARVRLSQQTVSQSFISMMNAAVRFSPPLSLIVEGLETKRGHAAVGLHQR